MHSWTLFGPGCVPQLAPANAAARLQGGGNVDAQCKLDRGSPLIEKTGALSAKVLKSLRWES